MKKSETNKKCIYDNSIFIQQKFKSVCWIENSILILFDSLL